MNKYSIDEIIDIVKKESARIEDITFTNNRVPFKFMLYTFLKKNIILRETLKKILNVSPRLKYYLKRKIMN